MYTEKPLQEEIMEYMHDLEVFTNIANHKANTITRPQYNFTEFLKWMELKKLDGIADTLNNP